MPNYEITMRKSLKIFESWRFLGISKCTRITSTKTISFWMKFWFYSINFDIFPKWQKSYVRLTFRNFDPKSRRFSITIKDGHFDQISDFALPHGTRAWANGSSLKFLTCFAKMQKLYGKKAQGNKSLWFSETLIGIKSCFVLNFCPQWFVQKIFKVLWIEPKCSQHVRSIALHVSNFESW